MLSMKVNGAKLRAVREDRGFTGEELAAAIAESGHPVTASMLHKIENDTRQPGAKLFDAICRALQCNKDALLDIPTARECDICKESGSLVRRAS